MACADILQIGARNMQNFALLEEVGALPQAGACSSAAWRRRSRSCCSWPPSTSWRRATRRDPLRARHPHLRDGHAQHARSERRAASMKRSRHLPVIVDPSHGTGHAAMVAADGARRRGGGRRRPADRSAQRSRTHALSDGAQSLTPDGIRATDGAMIGIAAAVGRRLPRRWRRSVRHRVAEVVPSRRDSACGVIVLALAGAAADAAAAREPVRIQGRSPEVKTGGRDGLRSPGKKQRIRPRGSRRMRCSCGASTST